MMLGNFFMMQMINGKTVLKFNLLHTDPNTKARAGTIETDHGSIATPIFMPVGTVASVKGVHQRELREEIDPDIILGNTYHLYLRPGMETIKVFFFFSY